MLSPLSCLTATPPGYAEVKRLLSVKTLTFRSASGLVRQSSAYFISRLVPGACVNDENFASGIAWRATAEAYRCDDKEIMEKDLKCKIREMVTMGELKIERFQTRLERLKFQRASKAVCFQRSPILRRNSKESMARRSIYTLKVCPVSLGKS